MGCASTEKPRTIYTYVPTPTPESLLVKPCFPYYAKEDVGSLYKANERNISCINQYYLVLDNISKYNNTIKGESVGGFTK